MKDSGIDWIGEIPEEWNFLKYKNISIIMNGFPFDSNMFDTIEGFPLIRIRDISSGTIETFYKGTFNDKYVVEKGDILVGMDGDFNIRKWSGVNALLNQRCLRIKGLVEEYNGLIYYQLPFVLRKINDLAYSTTVKHLSHFSILNAKVVIPPLDDLRKILSVLDQKVANIDNIIEKTKESIEEYKKLKQSIITESVTKGMNFNVKMKDSGIDWIGQIPVHWELTKFKRVASVKSNLVSPHDYPDYVQVSPDRIEKDTGVLLSCDTVSEVGVESWNHKFFKGQILYSKIRPMLNKVTIAPVDGLCSADMYPIETQMNSEFLKYFMLSDAFLTQVTINDNRVKMPKVNQDELSTLDIVSPPLTEQIDIAEKLKTKLSKISELIGMKEKLILEIESYKKSLIYEVVTGKKEII